MNKLFFILSTLFALPLHAQTVYNTTYCGTQISIVQGDLLNQNADVVVNAANETLIGAAGVAKAIQVAAGQKEFVAYVQKNIPADAHGIRCPIGAARITPAFELQAQNIKHIVHTVGPRKYSRAEQNLLKSCYAQSLEIARANKAESIAFPAISIGIFNYPYKKAAQAAAMATVQWVKAHPGHMKKIVFTIWTDPKAQAYGKLLQQELENAQQPYSLLSILSWLSGAFN